MLSLLLASLADPSPGKWTVDFGDTYCQASRSNAEARGPTSLFIRPPLDPAATTRVIFSRGVTKLSGDPMRSAKIDFGDGGAPYIAQAQASLAKDSFYHELDLPADQARRLRRSAALVVSSSAKIAGRYDLSSVDSAFAALDRCKLDLHRHLGIAIAADIAQPASPRSELGSLFTSARYWTMEVRKAQGNRVMVSLLIDKGGNVRDCAIIEGSGSDAIDRQTCQIFRFRTAYSPAVDRTGAAVSSLHRETITWHR